MKLNNLIKKEYIKLDSLVYYLLSVYINIDVAYFESN